MSSEDKVKRKFNQLKGLQKSPDQPKLSDEELMEKAKKAVEKAEADEIPVSSEIDVEAQFIDKTEKKLAKELLKKYLADYVIETVSDKNSLIQLIYLEVLNLGMQKSLNDARKDSGAIPIDTVEIIHKNIQEITKLKSTLGIAKGKKEDSRDGYSYLELMMKKYKVWLKENQATRSMLCPYCSKQVMWKIRPEAWEAQKHPFFKDRILGNSKLIELYKAGKIDRKDLAEIFQVSPFYIDWLVEKGWGLNVEIKKIKEEKEGLEVKSPPVSEGFSDGKKD